MKHLSAIGCVMLLAGPVWNIAADALPPTPGPLVEYRALAFQPQVWEQKKISTLLLPWTASNIVFLTTNGTYDPVLMNHWVSRLDQGWALYADLTGARPRPFKQLDGRTTIAAVPGFEFTCGAGCGYVGAGGIELAMFYRWNYPALQKNSNAIPHYVFYEMGRNFYTFGERHAAFTTGFAVFMRYVCMDALGCTDDDAGTRRTIEGVEPLIRTGKMPFLKTFTNADGLSEKEPRVKDAAGHWVQPSDQPVAYAAAMLRLRRDYGGDDWVRRFFRALAQCPPARANTREGALAQSWNWLVAASVAARKDLSPVFVDDWRLPLSAESRKELAAVDWTAPGTTAAIIMERIKPRWNAAP